MKITKTVSPKMYDYLIKPLAFLAILLGIETTCGFSDGSEKIYNSKGERWKWLKDLNS